MLSFGLGVRTGFGLLSKSWLSCDYVPEGTKLPLEPHIKEAAINEALSSEVGTFLEHFWERCCGVKSWLSEVHLI